MEASDVPASRSVGTFCPHPSTDHAVRMMAEAFGTIFETGGNEIEHDTVITHTEPVLGFPFSARVLYAHEHEGAFPVPTALTLVETARDILTELIEEARFCDSQPASGITYHRGFEVLKMYIDGFPAVLIRAVMVPFQ